MHRFARRGRRRDAERGASALEFALVLPVLITLVFGIIGFGVLFAQQLSLSNASRQAARFGAVDGQTCDSITAEARNVASTIAMSGSSVGVLITRGTTPPTAATPSACASGATEPCAGSSAGQNVYVRTTFTSTMVVPFMQPTFDLTATGAFRCEFS